MTTEDRMKRIARLQNLADALDSRFSVFGIPVGWDSLLGLVPGLGALVTTVPTGLMVIEGIRLGARKRTAVRMAWNGWLDVTIGAVPIFGDVFDLFFKSHQRNVALLRDEFERTQTGDDIIPFETFLRSQRQAVSQSAPSDPRAPVRKRRTL
ncbi:MAG: DUF4112 domain-containing protein [Paracoccaceae bacterium]